MYNDIPIFIFSSGSVQAQKLLFKYSDFGDLTKVNFFLTNILSNKIVLFLNVDCLFQYISGYFDTTTGSKLEAASYEKIAEKIGYLPNEILFVTDIEKG